jgi:hypothetical protein
MKNKTLLRLKIYVDRNAYETNDYEVMLFDFPSLQRALEAFDFMQANHTPCQEFEIFQF